MNKYDRINTYPIEAVLANVLYESRAMGKEAKVDFDGYAVNMANDKYKLFDTKGIVCMGCGIKGEYFAMERICGEQHIHFNLYSIDEHGDEVLMTKDHILPKALGGENTIDNYQTMCVNCNASKGARMLSLMQWESIPQHKLKVEYIKYILHDWRMDING